MVKNSLIIYKSNQIEDIIYPCNLCIKVFWERSNLEEHINFHEAKDSFVRNKSPEAFDRKNVSMNNSEMSIESTLSCDLCPKTFSQKNYFKEHLKSHMGTNLFRCYQCSESFLNRIDLKTHASIHINEGNLFLPFLV